MLVGHRASMFARQSSVRLAHRLAVVHQCESFEGRCEPRRLRPLRSSGLLGTICSPPDSGILAVLSPAFTRQISGLARGRTTMMMQLTRAEAEKGSGRLSSKSSGRVATGGKTLVFTAHVHMTVESRAMSARAPLPAGK